MVGNSQFEFTVKIHTFIPRNSLEFQEPFHKGIILLGQILQAIEILTYQNWILIVLEH